jgi:Ankyrin repeats (3 copies)
VFCQLDRLRRCIVSRIRHALDELPETLDETYERTLLDIDKENWAYAHRLFQCLVVALRPLRVEELAEFLAFEFEDGRSPIFQADCRPEDPRDAVLSTCSSLIAVVDDDGSAVVQFSHFSVKEYLTSTRIAEGRVPQYNIHLGSAHFLVTQACFSTLLGLDDQITEERMKDFPLVEYAARYWVGHAKIGNGLSQTEDIVKQLFDPRNPHFAAWISICDMKPQATHYPPIKNSRPTPLYYAAELNLRGVAEWLVNERSQNINAFGGYHGTPLHAASGSGSLEVMEFLLMCHEDGNRVSDDHTHFYVVSEGG